MKVPETKAPLRVIIVEDSENDAVLLELELQRAGYDTQCLRVETSAAMNAALDSAPWDLIIADYLIPNFGGLQALALVKQKGLDLPFVIVSGHITEDTAVAAMKAGAHDYVMKDKLARLGPAVQRELREAAMRRQRRRSEETLKVEHGITRILALAPTLEEAAPGILQLLVDGLKMTFGALWLAEGAALRPLVATVAGAERVEPELQSFLLQTRRLTLSPATSLAGQAWKERKPVWVPDLGSSGKDERVSSAMESGASSGMTFPMQSGSDCIGVLEFYARENRPEEPELVNMMTAIGSELAQFIKRRRAEEALRRAHDELEMRVQQRTAELKAANTRLEDAIRERKRLEQELLEITEKERRRIGLDLHDDLGQKLSGIALMTKGLENRLAKLKASEAQEAARIHALVEQAMSHTSDLAHDLATLDVKQGDLKAALSQLAAHAKELFEISCRFKAEGAIPALEHSVVSQLYKIAQEAVTNAIKHGKTKHVSINLANGSNRIVLTVQNDGVPFPDLQSRSTGMGLRIMNYRASLIGGSLDIKGTGANGTRVICSVPLPGH